MRHPLPEGTRVHHRACEWNHYFTEEECQQRPSWGWGTVLRVHSGPYSDGSYEYEVEYDAPMFEGHTKTSQWASYHIDNARSAVVA